MQIFSEMHVLLALFSYVKANDTVGPPLTAIPTRDWTAAQYEEIQLLAMSALCTLAPLMLDDYITCHGGTRLLLMLEWCISNGTRVSCVSCREMGAAYISKNWECIYCQCELFPRYCHLFTVCYWSVS